MKIKTTPPVLGFCAYSGTGKTTLLKALIPYLAARGYSIGVIKHAHHEFDTDQPGKDSYELRKAGARQMLVSSSRRNVLITELAKEENEPALSDLLERFDDGTPDLILVEGFKHETFKKIELHRPSLGTPLIYPNDPSVIALATDEPERAPIPVLDLNDTGKLAEFIIKNIMRPN